MGCNCDCYCGCDTKPNRLKFAASAALFFLWVVLGIVNWMRTKACLKDYPSDCYQYDAALIMGSGHSSMVPLTCEEAYGTKMKCTMDVVSAPAYLLTDLLRLMLLVGFIVPLAMLCCCTKNPHKMSAYHGTQMVPPVAENHAAASALPDDPGMQSLEVPMEPAMLQGKLQDKRSSSTTSGGSATIAASHNTKDGYSSLLEPQ